MLPNLPKKIEDASLTELLSLLQDFQNQSHTGFSPGLFFSERRISGFYSRPDNTLFFNLSIAFILKTLLAGLNGASKEIALSVIERTNLLLPQYRNKDGEVSWNFWKTNPSHHFPLGRFAHRFRFFQIPDDIDDSALALMLSNPTQEMNVAFHQKMQRYANGSFKTINYLPERWRKLPVYNTFFIKDMPCGFDFVALTNVMIWQRFSGITPGPCDEATKTFLDEALQSKLLQVKPELFSPYYPRLALLIYHAARLEFLIPGFFSPQAKKALENLINLCATNKKNPMDNLLIQIAAMKLNISNIFEGKIVEKDLDDFVFFVAGLFEEFSSPLIKNLRKLPFTHITYHCKPMALTIWIEYLVLKEKLQSQ